MAIDFFIPKLGQTVEEVTIVNWLIEDGAKVNFGQEVMEVETDKAVFPVEANGKGYIHIGPYKAGDVLPVLTVVAYIGGKDETFESLAGQAAPAAGEAESQVEAAPKPAESAEPAAQPQESPDDGDRVFASPRARRLAEEKNVDLSLVTPTGGGGVRAAERDVIAYLKQAPKATPLAQRMADAAQVDLRAVSGTGPGGKIVKEDVQRAAQEKQAPAPAAPAAPLPEAEILERVPLSGVRAIIAERMAASVHTTARVTLVTEVDATEFVAARTRLKQRVEAEWGFAPGYNDLLVLIVAAALRQYPYMNARLTPDAIERLAQVNVGLAVDTERGLLVPVVRDADRKNLQEIGQTFREMAERAKKGRSLPDDLNGGTFTITNLGAYDIDAFTPVINLPEAAILGVGRIALKPAVYQGELAVRQMLTLSLVFDHRLVDGAPAAKFLQYIRQMIEEPYLLLAA